MDTNDVLKLVDEAKNQSTDKIVAQSCTTPVQMPNDDELENIIKSREQQVEAHTSSFSDWTKTQPHSRFENKPWVVWSGNSMLGQFANEIEAIEFADKKYLDSFNATGSDSPVITRHFFNTLRSSLGFC